MGGGGRVFGDEFEGFEHGFVDGLVGRVDHSPDRGGVRVGGLGEHVFDGGGEVGEGPHEGDDTLAFLDLDFGVFDAADLFFDKARELAGQAIMDTR